MKKDKQRIKLQKFKGAFTQSEKKLYIDPYLELLGQN